MLAQAVDEIILAGGRLVALQLCLKGINVDVWAFWGEMKLFMENQFRSVEYEAARLKKVVEYEGSRLRSVRIPRVSGSRMEIE